MVTGATGNVGREVAQILTDGGHPVRLLGRTPGPDVVLGDLNDPSTLDGPLDGVTGVFLLPGYADMPGALAACARARVERVVLISGGSLDESHVLPTVEEVTGREPGSFAAWANRHAPDFAA